MAIACSHISFSMLQKFCWNRYHVLTVAQLIGWLRWGLCCTALVTPSRNGRMFLTPRPIYMACKLWRVHMNPACKLWRSMHIAPLQASARALTWCTVVDQNARSFRIPIKRTTLPVVNLFILLISVQSRDVWCFVLAKRSLWIGEL